MVMEKRKLGTLEVSSIGLGCMGMSQSYGAAADRDEAQSVKVIHRALELGVNFFDTAEVYGPYKNEELLGRAFRGHRNEAIIATKFGFDIKEKPPHEVDSSPKTIRKAVEGSLKRLSIDTIDLLYQHRVDPKIPIEEVVGVMAELIKEGKVRFLGLSEAGAATIERAHKEHAITALQSEYSLWERGIEDEILPMIQKLGIGLVPFCPVGRGFLTGQIKSYEDIPEGDFRRNDPRYKGENFKKNLQLVQEVERIARKYSGTAAQVAIAWTLHQGGHIVPIPGTKRISFLEENAAASTLKLDKDDIDHLNTLAQKTSGERYEESQLSKVRL
jgi:aryl-alcohol dehydrogenase-like predicted oxidoreductase